MTAIFLAFVSFALLLGFLLWEFQAFRQAFLWIIAFGLMAAGALGATNALRVWFHRRQTNDWRYR